MNFLSVLETTQASIEEILELSRKNLARTRRILDLA